MAEPITNVLGTVAIKHCGEYDATMHYEKLNVVTYNGSSYCAKDNTIGNLPTNTTYWNLMAEKGDKGDKGDTPVKGTDYYTEADKDELEGTLSSDVTTEVTSQLSNLTSATPLAASSTAGMTDTTRIYVNTTDGHWYWYNGTTWVDGGVYQATQDAETMDIRETYDSVLFDTAGNAVRAQVNQLKEIHDNYVLKGLNRIKGKFKQGRVHSSGVNDAIHYRIRSLDKLTYPYDIKIPEIVDAYTINVVVYENIEDTSGTTISAHRGYITIPANTLFMIGIKKTVEDTSVNADVYAFSKNALYVSEQTMTVNNIENKINNNYANINKKLDSPFYSISQLEGTLTLNKLIGTSNNQEYSSAGKQYLTITEGFNVGDTLLISGRSATNANEYPCCFFVDSNNQLLSVFGNTSPTTYVDEEMIVPYGTAIIYINGNTSTGPCDCKKKVYNTELNLSETLYPLNIAESLVREAKKNPFEFSPLDKGYISFVFDDTRQDMDLVASIFEEYGFKLGLATIPAYLNLTCNGLIESSGSYTPGMTRKAVCDRVVELGGEIMAHNGSVITQGRQYDYDFMYNYFIQTKKDLENNGYKVRGLIRAGGTGSISHTPEIEKWLIGNYEYSNQGTALNYYQDRYNIADNKDTVKNLILEAYNNHIWRKFMGHGIASTTSGNQISEADLREILSYCQTLGITVVTYADMFDNFSSSKLLNFISENN